MKNNIQKEEYKWNIQHDLNFKNLTLYLSKFLYIKYIHEERQNIEKTLKITIAFFFLVLCILKQIIYTYM